jgi:hypothetical protein
MAFANSTYFSLYQSHYTFTIFSARFAMTCYGFQFFPPSLPNPSAFLSSIWFHACFWLLHSTNVWISINTAQMYFWIMFPSHKIALPHVSLRIICSKILQKMSRKCKKTLPAKFTNEITFHTFSDLLRQHVGSVVVCFISNLPNNRNCEAERGPAFFFLMRGGTFSYRNHSLVRQLLHSAATQIQSTLMIVSISPRDISLKLGSILSVSQVT